MFWVTEASVSVGAELPVGIIWSALLQINFHRLWQLLASPHGQTATTHLTHIYFRSLNYRVALNIYISYLIITTCNFQRLKKNKIHQQIFFILILFTTVALTIAQSCKTLLHNHNYNSPSDTIFKSSTKDQQYEYHKTSNSQRFSLQIQKCRK